VGRALELYNPETIRQIQITESSSNPAGEFVFNWLMPDGVTSGSCVVSSQGQILEYRRARASSPGFPGGGGGQPDLSWGREVPPYQGQVVAGGGQRLYIRPLSDSRQIAFANGGEAVTISRTYSDPSSSWVLVRTNSGQQGWLDARNLSQGTSGGGGAYGNNPAVEYNWGQEIRPVQAQVSYGSMGGVIFGTSNYELMNRPDNAQGSGRPVGLVAGGERVTVYRQVAVGQFTWVLVKGSRGQEGWINSRRLIQI
jgi:hypothetical protein